MPVTSSALRSMGYDDGSRLLELEYVSGEVYQYLEVDPADVVALRQADSMGRFVNERIKPRYAYVHVDEA